MFPGNLIEVRSSSSSAFLGSRMEPIGEPSLSLFSLYNNVRTYTMFDEGHVEYRVLFKGRSAL